MLSDTQDTHSHVYNEKPYATQSSDCSDCELRMPSFFRTAHVLDKSVSPVDAEGAPSARGNYLLPGITFRALLSSLSVMHEFERAPFMH
jgi:hypothetical protein